MHFINYLCLIFSRYIYRIHDVYNNRILQVLSSMQLVTFHTFPEDGLTWTPDEFLDKIDETCRQASMVCNFIQNFIKSKQYILIPL